MTANWPPPRATREALERFWRLRLDETHERYEAAVADTAQVLARRAKSEALAEYKRVLQIFTDLIVYGKEPKE